MCWKTSNKLSSRLNWRNSIQLNIYCTGTLLQAHCTMPDLTKFVLRRFSHVWFFVIPWSVACQAPLSMGFPRRESWSGLPFPPPGDLPIPGSEPLTPVAPALACRFFTTEPPGKLLKPNWLSSYCVPDAKYLTILYLKLAAHWISSSILRCGFMTPFYRGRYGGWEVLNHLGSETQTRV